MLILPGDDEHYYSYDDVDLSAARVAHVVTRAAAEEAGYRRLRRPAPAGT